MGIFDGLVEAGTAYYAGKEGITDAEAAGQAGLGVGQEIGTTAAGMAEFKPYTVTSGLATGTTTPEGGLNLQLSPEEQARQNQYLGQSQSMFGGLTGDVAGGSQAIYEQMRAAQRPEEEALVHGDLHWALRSLSPRHVSPGQGDHRPLRGGRSHDYHRGGSPGGHHLQSDS